MLDQELRERIIACGLDLDELERIFEASGYSVGSVMGRICSAEADIALASAAAERTAAAAARAEAGDGVGSRRWRRSSGRSFSMSVRLDFEEYEDLRRRAEQRGIGVSVLARSYIRNGLSTPTLRLTERDW